MDPINYVTFLSHLGVVNYPEYILLSHKDVTSFMNGLIKMGDINRLNSLMNHGIYE